MLPAFTFITILVFGIYWMIKYMVRYNIFILFLPILFGAVTVSAVIAEVFSVTQYYQNIIAAILCITSSIIPLFIIVFKSIKNRKIQNEYNEKLFKLSINKNLSDEQKKQIDDIINRNQDKY